VSVASIPAAMMQAANTYQTSVNFYQASRRNIPEESKLHSSALFVYTATNSLLISETFIICAKRKFLKTLSDLHWEQQETYTHDLEVIVPCK
jgi:hypothetical protein